MLQLLEIKNYAIIDHSVMEFGSGLNIITGETGAGKSILLGALGLTLGDRADNKVLYASDKKCVVEATFSISQYGLESFFEEQGLDYENNTIIRREIAASGKSRAFINDTPVTLNILKALTEQLVNLHSQQETSSLNQQAFQLGIVDFSANNNSLLQDYKKAYNTWQVTQVELKAKQAVLAQSEKDFEYNTFLLNEIKEANLEGLDLAKLEEELNTLSNAEAIKQQLFAARNAIDNEEVSSLQLINSAYSSLLEIAKFSAGNQQLADRVRSTILELEDILQEIDLQASKMEVDDSRTAELLLTVNKANLLLKKHQLQSLEELEAFKEELKALTQGVTTNSLAIKKLEEEVDLHYDKLKQLGKLLTTSREKAKDVVAQQIMTTLHKVGMPSANFSVEVKPLTEPSPTGIDQVNFLFSANKGFAPQALKSIASGGELSRVMLSIKSLLAKSSALPTLIFDEIDTGISGETAAQVADVFKEISVNHQLISITHLPQIASKADTHFFISKTDKGERTHTHITTLNDEEHIHAIARMLSGEKVSEASISNAKQLIG